MKNLPHRVTLLEQAAAQSESSTNRALSTATSRASIEDRILALDRQVQVFDSRARRDVTRLISLVRPFVGARLDPESELESCPLDPLPSSTKTLLIVHADSQTRLVQAQLEEISTLSNDILASPWPLAEPDAIDRLERELRALQALREANHRALVALVERHAAAVDAYSELCVQWAERPRVVGDG